MKRNSSGGLIENLSTFIVEKRNMFFLLYIFAFIFCIFSMNWVYVENDVTSYLPDGTETRLGLEAMNENFDSFGTARIMVSNVTYAKAEELCDIIADIDGVDMVTFDNTPEHYINASALFDVNFSGGNLDERSSKSTGPFLRYRPP